MIKYLMNKITKNIACEKIVDGERWPWYYGKVYFDWESMCFVVAIIPINYLLQLFYITAHHYHKMRKSRSLIDKMVDRRVGLDTHSVFAGSSIPDRILLEYEECLDDVLKKCLDDILKNGTNGTRKDG